MMVRTLRRTALVVTGLVALIAAAAPSASAATGPTLPQPAAADAAAVWLASQFTPQGYIPVSPGSTQPDYGDTVQAVLAFETTRNENALKAKALTYLSKHINAYVRSGGHDGPGELAYLILAALGASKDPTTFGGTNLVGRLEATMRATGPQLGLFGVQSPTFDGAYRQGLSLTALAAAHVTGTTVAKAVSWLERQQCASGGWEAFRADTATMCAPVDPATFTGPDTNSTALAVDGLKAQGVPVAKGIVGWLAGAQTAYGGWPYQTGDAFDANSTAAVIQALLALGLNPTGARFDTGSQNVVAALLSLQVTSGSGQGGIAYQPNPDGSLTANVLATVQAIPALEGVKLIREALTP
jgi:hypothetical protein